MLYPLVLQGTIGNLVAVFIDVDRTEPKSKGEF